MTGRDGSLFLWQNRYDVYQYALETGAYQGSFPQAGHEAAFPMAFPPAERHPLAELPAGTVSYDALTVYRQTASGSVPVVARSGWVRLLFFVHIWALGFFSILLQILLEGPAGSWRKRRATPPVNPDAGGEQSCMKSGRQLSDGKEERWKEIQEGFLSGSTIRTCIHNRKCWMAEGFFAGQGKFS